MNINFLVYLLVKERAMKNKYKKTISKVNS